MTLLPYCVFAGQLFSMHCGHMPYANSEGPYQTAHPRSLIWAVTVRSRKYSVPHKPLIQIVDSGGLNEN